MSLIQMALECVLRLQMFSTDVAEVTIIRREVLCLQMILSRGFVLADFFTDEADEARSTSRVAAPKVLLGKRVKGQTWCDGPIGKCPAPPQSGNECTMCIALQRISTKVNIMENSSQDLLTFVCCRCLSHVVAVPATSIISPVVLILLLIVFHLNPFHQLLKKKTPLVTCSSTC